MTVSNYNKRKTKEKDYLVSGDVEDRVTKPNREKCMRIRGSGGRFELKMDVKKEGGTMVNSYTTGMNAAAAAAVEATDGRMAG